VDRGGAAEIFAGSTAKDTDFILRVSDVYPDGAVCCSWTIPCGPVREGFEKQVLLRQ